nr:hypothetical protein [Tanacetum cinerariifolium]
MNGILWSIPLKNIIDASFSSGTHFCFEEVNYAIFPMVNTINSFKECDGTGSSDWSYQAEEEPVNFALMDFSLNSSSDNETGLESVKARLLVYEQNESVFEENIKLLNIEKVTVKVGHLVISMIGSNQVVGTFMPPKPDLVFNTAPTAVETDRLAFNVQLSPPKPEEDLSHTSRPSAPMIYVKLYIIFLSKLT